MVGSCCFKGWRDRGPTDLLFLPCSHGVRLFFHVEMEHFLRPAGLSVYPGLPGADVSLFLPLTFRSLLHSLTLLVSHSIFLGHWLSSLAWIAFRISVHQQALYTSLCLTACCSVGYHFHTHLNMLPELFFLDSFSFKGLGGLSHALS